MNSAVITDDTATAAIGDVRIRISDDVIVNLSGLAHYASTRHPAPVIETFCKIVRTKLGTGSVNVAAAYTAIIDELWTVLKSREGYMFLNGMTTTLLAAQLWLKANEHKTTPSFEVHPHEFDA